MKKLIALAMLVISSASAQEQSVLLFGDLFGDPHLPPGASEDWDVNFSWNLTTDVASDFNAPFCLGALGTPQTTTVTVVGNQLIASGTCASSLGLINWGGSVDEQAPCNCNWFGGATGVVSPTAAPEPGTWLLMLTGLLLTACGRGLPQRLRPAARRVVSSL